MDLFSRNTVKKDSQVSNFLDLLYRLATHNERRIPNKDIERLTQDLDYGIPFLAPGKPSQVLNEPFRRGYSNLDIMVCSKPLEKLVAGGRPM